jgi:hypothetical protein
VAGAKSLPSRESRSQPLLLFRHPHARVTPSQERPPTPRSSHSPARPPLTRLNRWCGGCDPPILRGEEGPEVRGGRARQRQGGRSREIAALVHHAQIQAWPAEGGGPGRADLVGRRFADLAGGEGACAAAAWARFIHLGALPWTSSSTEAPLPSRHWQRIEWLRGPGSSSLPASRQVPLSRQLPTMSPLPGGRAVSRPFPSPLPRAGSILPAPFPVQMPSKR